MFFTFLSIEKQAFCVCVLGSQTHGKPEPFLSWWDFVRILFHKRKSCFLKPEMPHLANSRSCEQAYMQGIWLASVRLFAWGRIASARAWRTEPSVADITGLGVGHLEKLKHYVFFVLLPQWCSVSSTCQERAKSCLPVLWFIRGWWE